MSCGKVLILCSSLLLISCSDDSDINEDCDSNASCNPSEVSSDASFLQGQWELACYLDTDLPDDLEQVYRKVEVSFTGAETGAHRSDYSAHRSADCTDAAISNGTGTLTGTYLIGSNSTSEGGLSVRELDIMTESLTLSDGTTVSPVVDQPLVLTIAYVDDGTLYFGDNDDPDAEPPARSTRIDFSRPFTRQ